MFSRFILECVIVREAGACNICVNPSQAWSPLLADWGEKLWCELYNTLSGEVLGEDEGHQRDH